VAWTTSRFLSVDVFARNSFLVQVTGLWVVNNDHTEGVWFCISAYLSQWESRVRE